MVEDLKKGQLEVNTLDQKKGCYSEAEESRQTLKIIRLKRPHQTWNISIKLGNPPDSEDLKGPRLHVRFVLS